MRCQEIYNFLNDLSPFKLQEEWDNSGLQVGTLNDDVERIYVSLDIDSALLEEVEENSLLITHHPLIFKGLKQLNTSIYPSRLIKKLIKKNIALISMHTNFDKTHLNKYVATQVLGYDNLTCEGHICYFDVDEKLDDFCLHVKKSLNMDIIRVVGENKYIKRGALTTGSGGDLIEFVKADCFLTGDLKYHQALESKENNLCLIDIGHYESEHYFSSCLAENLENLPLKVIISNSKNPFDYK